MRISIILGRKDGVTDKVAIVSGPLPPDEQNEKFKKLIEGKGNGYAEIHLHELTLSGGRKRQNFNAPKDSRAQTAKLKKMALSTKERKPRKAKKKSASKQKAPKEPKVSLGKPAPDKTDGRGPTFPPSNDI